MTRTIPGIHHVTAICGPPQPNVDFYTAAARLRPRDLQRGCSAAQGRVFGDGEIEPEQADDGADQALRLAQRQPEYSPEGQSREDRQGRVPGLATPGGARFSRPPSDCLIGEPDRQAPTLAEAGVIGGPVRDRVLLPGDVVATGLVQLERQREHPKSQEGRSPTLPSSSAPTDQPPDPCNTATQAPSDQT